jgi:hypothetical protein
MPASTGLYWCRLSGTRLRTVHAEETNHMIRQRSRGPARLSRARALAAAATGTLLLLAYAERQFLVRTVVEVVLRLAQIAG